MASSQADTTLAGLDALDLGGARPSGGARERAARIASSVWPRLAAIVLVWIVWELIHLSGWKKLVLPGPGVTLSNLWDQARTGLLWHAIGDTLERALIGYALALVIGTVVGLDPVRDHLVRAEHLGDPVHHRDGRRAVHRERHDRRRGLHPAAAAQGGQGHGTARAEPDPAPDHARGAAHVRGRDEAGLGVHLARAADRRAAGARRRRALDRRAVPGRPGPDRHAVHDRGHDRDPDPRRPRGRRVRRGEPGDQEAVGTDVGTCVKSALTHR